MERVQVLVDQVPDYEEREIAEILIQMHEEKKLGKDVRLSTALLAAPSSEWAQSMIIRIAQREIAAGAFKDELLEDELEHVKRTQSEQAAAQAGAHFAFFNEAARRLHELGAFETEGIFRVPGAADIVSALQRQVAEASRAHRSVDDQGTSVEQRIRAVLQGCEDPHDMA